jgi:hypothetical protein
VLDLAAWEDVVAYDFEFQPEGGRHQNPDGRDSGGRPMPLCLVTRSLKTGRVEHYWREQLQQMRRAPFDTGPRTLAVNWFASAEAGCFAVLNWPRPHNLLDMHAEYRWWRNGIRSEKPPGLVDALAKLGLPGIGSAAKDANREKILTTSHWSEEDRRETLRYCESDVDGTAALARKMAPLLDMPRALLRGRYSGVCGVIETNGIPVDLHWWERLNRVREPLLLRLVKEVDRFGIYDGVTFKHKRFYRLLARLQIPWERTSEGGTQLKLEGEYFRDQAELYPVLQPLHLLRETLKKLHEPKLCIGPDGRNRTLLGPWGTVTGRNAFSTTKCIFGPDRWTRNTIVPPPGSALAYVDWSAQEIGIAALLSGDPNLLQTYLAPDPYLHFGKLAGLLPADAERESATVELMRDKIKILFLGLGYGMRLPGLVWRLGGDCALAERMWRLHHQLYADFWRWVQRTLDNADMRGRDWTMFGWQMRVVDNVRRPARSTRLNTLQNWPAQSHGSEMMRIAAIALVEAGVRVAFPLHDAFLIEGPEQGIAEIARLTQQVMARAGEAMFGIPFRAKIHTYNDRHFEDGRPGSREMFERVDRLLRESEAELGLREAA